VCVTQIAQRQLSYSIYKPFSGEQKGNAHKNVSCEQEFYRFAHPIYCSCVSWECNDSNDIWCESKSFLKAVLTDMRNVNDPDDILWRDKYISREKNMRDRSGTHMFKSQKRTFRADCAQSTTYTPLCANEWQKDS